MVHLFVKVANRGIEEYEGRKISSLKQCYWQVYDDPKVRSIKHNCFTDVEGLNNPISGWHSVRHEGDR